MDIPFAYSSSSMVGSPLFDHGDFASIVDAKIFPSTPQDKKSSDLKVKKEAHGRTCMDD